MANNGKKYTIAGGNLEVTLSSLGACITSIKYRGEEMLMTFPTDELRVKSGTYAGATIGRVANRIAKGFFSLGRETFVLSESEGRNTLHGGMEGFDKKTFELAETKPDAVTFSLVSPDGDQGFPGKMDFAVRFQIEDDALNVTFTAKADRATVFAPTMHPYFRLGEKKDVLPVTLTLYADAFLPVNAELIPTGEIRSVAGTAFDFRRPKPIGRDLSLENPDMVYTLGYDHNFVLGGSHAATAEGRLARLDVYTDMPGVQFYSGNCIKPQVGMEKLGPFDGFCLEPQFYPNAVNTPTFPSAAIGADVKTEHYIVYKFSERK